MMDLVDIIGEFEKAHPVWAWALKRLFISICSCTIAAVGFFTLVAVFAPFALIAEGAGMEAFLWWLFVPFAVAVAWMLISAINYVVEEMEL